MSVLNAFSLEGKVALVTGGAGRHAPQFILALAEAGATVYGADINLEGMRSIADGLRSTGFDVIPARVDQANEASILSLRDQIMEQSGRVDVLVNATVRRPMTSWQDDIALFEESMRVNGTGLFMMTRAFGDVMEQQGSGSIINIGSIHGVLGPDRSLYEGLDFDSMIPDYFFHKGGMANFTRFVASYYGPKGVRCNCVVLGGIGTESTPLEFGKRYSERTMLKRMANHSDLKGVVVFLASEASLYVTAASLVVDGGYSAK